MLHSMTGFARQIDESPLGTLTCELRAVNHRYLDLQFRMPDELRAKEADFRQQVGKVLQRGKVDCSLFIRRESGGNDSMPLNQELLATLAARLSEVQSRVPDAGAVNPLDVLRWPGVVDEPPLDTEPLYEAARKLLGSTLDELTAMRASEGKRIADMLTSRCDDILQIAATVRERMPQVLEHVRTKQRERIARLDVAADPARLETELALIAQKLDVDEELDRLESHISEIRQNIDKTEAVGRRLDFLMQELNREANTLGSKSGDTRTTRAAVDLKVLIEQMREQIQNVE